VAYLLALLFGLFNLSGGDIPTDEATSYACESTSSSSKISEDHCILHEEDPSRQQVGISNGF
jgi:hypothetical protein